MVDVRLTPNDLATLTAALTAAEAALSRRAGGRYRSVPSPEKIVLDAAKTLNLNWRDCSPAERLDILHAVRLTSIAWLRKDGDRLEAILYPNERAFFGDAKGAVERAFGRAARFIRNMIFAGWLAFMGPREPMAAEADAINRAVGRQMAYLDTFHDQVLTEDKQFVPARLASYGGAVWGTTFDIVRTIIHKGTVFKFERRVHIGPEPSPGAYDPCAVCISERDKGIVPIGTLKAIGDSPCQVNCHCRFGWYVTEDGDEYVAGDPDVYARISGIGPFHEPAFGTRNLGASSACLVGSKP